LSVQADRCGGDQRRGKNRRAAVRHASNLTSRLLLGEIFGRHDAARERTHGCLSAILGTELGEHVTHVRLDGLLADVERDGDVLIRFARC
jgi:hypothetical protein